MVKLIPRRIISTGPPEVEINDAFPIVNEAINRGTLHVLKRQWRAHPNLQIEVDSTPIRIESHVLRMLHAQAQVGAQIGEIPLYFLRLNGNKRDLGLIKAMWVGPADRRGSVKFSGGDNYFAQALNAVKSLNGTMPLGHTHPAGYGPIFSHVAADALNQDGKVGTSADYHIADTFASTVGSDLHLMTAVHPQNPATTMLSVIQIKPNHTIVFHPWEAVHPTHVKKLKR